MNPTGFPNFSVSDGFVFFWDDVTKAPYGHHPEKGLDATFDDKRSVALKQDMFCSIS